MDLPIIILARVIVTRSVELREVPLSPATSVFDNSSVDGCPINGSRRKICARPRGVMQKKQ
jgi:hypothetical protein